MYARVSKWHLFLSVSFIPSCLYQKKTQLILPPEPSVQSSETYPPLSIEERNNLTDISLPLECFKIPSLKQNKQIITYKISNDIHTLYGTIRASFEGNAWTEIFKVLSQKSIIIFEKKSRLCVILISDNDGCKEVMYTVGPKKYRGQQVWPLLRNI